MPILADALQDAGCDSDDILDHCRGPGPHVRGCWVVDLGAGQEVARRDLPVTARTTHTARPELPTDPIEPAHSRGRRPRTSYSNFSGPLLAPPAHPPRPRSYHVAELTTSGVVRDILTGEPRTCRRRGHPKGQGQGAEGPRRVHPRRRPQHPERRLEEGRGQGRPGGGPRHHAAEGPGGSPGPGRRVPAAATAAAPTWPAVLANVALVNAVVGPVPGAWRTPAGSAEAVRSCGGVDAFLQHLDLVAGIRAPRIRGLTAPGVPGAPPLPVAPPALPPAPAHPSSDRLRSSAAGWHHTPRDREGTQRWSA